ncbi:MAG: tripartite tricarboxylate transporter substrate binding protein [Pseudomonadota bacterium]
MKRRTLALLCAAICMAGMAGPALADYPDKPIRLIIPFAAGGATDVVGRALANAMSRNMGQQVVVDNKPGAGGILAGTLLVKAPPDGYTILMGSIGMLSIGPNLRSDLPYSIKDSFVPVAQVSATPNIIVAHPSLKANNLRELIAQAKAEPGKIPFGSSGPATSTHLSGELFQAMAGVKLVHVPYKGGAQALNDLLAGQIPLMFDTMSAVQSVKAGKLKAFGITSDKRSPLLPDVPTVAEAGLPGYKTSSWNGIMAPAGTPREVVARLNAEINKALSSPDVQKSLAADGSETRGGTAEEFGRFIADETQRWGKLIKDAGIKASE